MFDINLLREWVCNGKELKPKNGAFLIQNLLLLYYYLSLKDL